MRALVLYHHGLGDVLMLTPHLRKIHEMGYEIDLMCRKEVETSHLLDNCPYVENLIEIENPWRSEIGFDAQALKNIEAFKKRGARYDWMGMSLHTSWNGKEHKIDMTSRELGLVLDSRCPMVFVSEEIEKEVESYVKENYPDGFVHAHTKIEFHSNHNFDYEDGYGLPIVDTGVGGDHFRKWGDINYTFALQKMATHRVYASSVFVHSADALGLDIDILHYGEGGDAKVRPVNCRVLEMREGDKWLR